jgi:hypothetical protein
MVTTSWADEVKEEALPAWTTSTDASPDVGPVSYPQVDDQWDLLLSADVGGLTADNQLLGGEFADGQFYITSGAGTDPNVVYMVSADGLTLNGQFDQWSSPGWGWRDLAYDGTYMYGSDDLVVDAFDLGGNPVPGSNINGPYSPCRALAYDPVLDHFWTASFSSPLYEFDRTGAVIWSGSTGLSGVYGAAWDDGAPDGPWLWIFDQSGTPQTSVHQFNPVTHTMTGFSYQVPLLPTSTDQLAGGLFFTDEWDPSYYVLGGVTQGTPNDMVFVLEMYDAANPYAPAAPENLVVTPDAGGALTCDLTWDLPTTTVNGSPIASYPITSVEIERDGAHLTSLAATATSYTDNVPSADMYTYRVYCVNDSGNGIGAQDGAWVGLDVPGAPTNVVAVSPADLTVDLTWDAPTAGQHGGYFPPGSWDGQYIYRNGTLLTTLTGTNTSYTDNLTFAGSYVYGVSYYNGTGEGPVGEAPEVAVTGPPQYAVSEIAYNWIEVNANRPGALPGTNTGINGDDQNLGPFPIDFDFPYYNGVTHNGMRVCSNGFASFTSTATNYSNSPIPTAAEPNNLLAVYWDDLNLSTTSTYAHGEVWYYNDPGGAFFVMEFDSCAKYGSTVTGEYYTFEIILYPDGIIEYMYKDVVHGTSSISATVGIENAAGDDGIQCTYNASGPYEPVSQYGLRFGPPVAGDVDVELTYLSGSPVPAGGGNLTFDVWVENFGTVALDYDAWIDVAYEGGDPMTVVNRSFTNYLPGWSINRPGMFFPVPGTWPAGNWTFTGKAGNHPDVVWDESGFPFVKEGSDSWTGSLEIPTGYPNPFGEEGEALVLPDKFALHGAYPNPFNPTATISFSLPEAAKVTLTVYDVSGRQVAELVNAWRDAGLHDAVFDASDLASGVYLYNLTAGSFNATGKMVLMK